MSGGWATPASAHPDCYRRGPDVSVLSLFLLPASRVLLDHVLIRVSFHLLFCLHYTFPLHPATTLFYLNLWLSVWSRLFCLNFSAGSWQNWGSSFLNGLVLWLFGLVRTVGSSFWTFLERGRLFNQLPSHPTDLKCLCSPQQLTTWKLGFMWWARLGIGLQLFCHSWVLLHCWLSSA